MTDNLEIIRTYSQTLTDSELAKAWRILYEEHQRRGEENAKVLKHTLKAGDQVEWTGRRGTITGEVIRVKRKKCIVAEHLAGKTSTVAQSGRWDIPMAMLRKITN